MDDSLSEEVLLDANKEAKAYEFYTVGEIEVPPQSAPHGPSSLLACLLRSRVSSRWPRQQICALWPSLLTTCTSAFPRCARAAAYNAMAVL